MNLDYKSRQIDFRKENIEYLRKIVPAENYQAEQNYEALINQPNEFIRRSGHPGIEDNIINPFLKNLLKLLENMLCPELKTLIKTIS